MTLLPHLDLSLPPGAQPSGLTSAKCALKSGEGPFHHHPPPHSSSSSPPSAPPPLPPTPVPSFSHTLARWQGGGIIVTRAGFMESGPMAKTKRHLSIPVGNTPPPPPPTGVQGLIRYALIRHIDRRRDSISPESSHGTFIPGEAKKTALTPAKRRRTFVANALEGCRSAQTAEGLNPGSCSSAAMACGCVRPAPCVTWEIF